MTTVRAAIAFNVRCSRRNETDLDASELSVPKVLVGKCRESDRLEQAGVLGLPGDRARAVQALARMADQ